MSAVKPWEADAVVTPSAKPWESDALVTPQAPQVSQEDTQGVPRPPQSYLDAQEEGPMDIDLLGNASTILGVGGSMVGGIPGGAIGSAIGGAIEEWYGGTDEEYERAAKEGMISLGIDSALKLIPKPAMFAFMAAQKLLKRSPQEAAEAAAEEVAKGSAGEWGSILGKEQSQRIAETGGATLNNFQLGKEFEASTLAHTIAETSLLGRGVFESNTAKATEIVQKRLDVMFGNSKLSAGEIGTNFTDAQQQARAFKIGQYEDSLIAFRTRLGKDRYNVAPLRKGLENFMSFGQRSKKKGALRSYKSATSVEQLSPEASKVYKEMFDELGEKATTTPNFLLEFDAILTKKISEARHANPNGLSSDTDRQLGDLQAYMKRVVQKELKGIDKGVAKDYSTLKKSYGNSMNLIFPEINNNLVRAGNKESYEVIGNLFAGSKDTSKIKKAMNSLEEVYRVLPEDQIVDTGFKSLKEAKKAIRASYAESALKSYDLNLDPKLFTKLAKELNGATDKAKVKAIMGEEFESFRKTVNLMADASISSGSGLASLFLNSKQFGAVSSVVGAIAAGSTLTGVGAAGAGVILGVPWVMAKMANNPNNINKLIKLHKLDPTQMPREKFAHKALMILRQMTLHEEEFDAITDRVISYVEEGK